MRLTIFFCLAASLFAAERPKLIPYPQSVQTGSGEFVLESPGRIAVISKSAADRFSAEVLRDDLQRFVNLRPTIVATAGPSTILIGRPGDPAIDSAVARLKLDTSVLDKAESYVAGADSAGAVIAAKSDSGVHYGVQTFRQLIRRTNGKVTIPQIAIADWPALRYRGISVDVSRGPILTEEQLMSTARTLAEYKLNMMSLYMEHIFPYKHTPMVTPEGAEIAPAMIKRLVDYAAKYHVEVVPQQQTFGHLHHMLKLERYADMGELPYGHVLAAEDTNAYDWIKQAAEQQAAATRSKFLHIGSDETAELGRGRSKELADRIGVGKVYMGHMTKVADMLRPLNRTLMFWGDIALNHPEFIPNLPKDMIAMTWVYEPYEEFSKYIVPFQKAGLQFFVCPGVNNWSRIFPNYTNALGNINNFVRDGKKAGALGMFNTEWADDGEALFNMTWYGIVFSGAAAWQQGTVDVAEFDRSFDWAFHRSHGNTFAKATRQLNSIHDRLKATGAGDGNDELTWFDPFSRMGALRLKQLLPAATQIRKLAEEAYVEVATHDADARHHRELLPLLRFAAKRFDYVGMKVQFAASMAQAYRDGQPRSGGGRATDLRDYINELKVAYRSLWMAENRPYWIDNVLVRFENEAL